jgi:hypothetical protein
MRRKSAESECRNIAHLAGDSGLSSENSEHVAQLRHQSRKTSHFEHELAVPNDKDNRATSWIEFEVGYETR